MFEPESNSAGQPAASTPDGVGKWKMAVQAFFSTEWTNLRDLIRRLEERDWDGAELTAPDETRGKTKGFHQEIVEHFAKAKAVEPRVVPPAVHAASTPPAPLPPLPVTTPAEVPAVAPAASTSIPAPLVPGSEPAVAQRSSRLAELAKKLESQLNRDQDNE